MNIEDAHKKIEEIYGGSVDHAHADMLHRFIDEQEEKIEDLTESMNYYAFQLSDAVDSCCD